LIWQQNNDYLGGSLISRWTRKVYRLIGQPISIFSISPSFF
jgi:hypothetical protein